MPWSAEQIPHGTTIRAKTLTRTDCSFLTSVAAASTTEYMHCHKGSQGILLHVCAQGSTRHVAAHMPQHHMSAHTKPNHPHPAESTGQHELWANQHTGSWARFARLRHNLCHSLFGAQGTGLLQVLQLPRRVLDGAQWNPPDSLTKTGRMVHAAITTHRQALTAGVGW
jgi:hypothetical protein